MECLISTVNLFFLATLIFLQCFEGSFSALLADDFKHKTGEHIIDHSVINVHIVPHTHDDAGWLKTVDQYYYGSNNSIQHACVQCILDSTIAALEENPERRFLYVETSFLFRWWRQQTEAKKAVVRQLFKEGRLEVANGGWVMHDEACAHYVAMVDQTTLGHSFLQKEFGVVPTIGWQIDPFGHSSTQASLLSAGVGFKGLFFGRIDYQDREKRIEESRMEMMWQASRSLPDLQVFTGAFHSGNYGAPEGFCFDTLCTDNPIMDDPMLKDYNVDDMVEAFVNHCLNEANHTVGSHLMVVMGMDFQYENAHMNFKNIDKLIKYVNEDGRVNAFYSTPSNYLDAKLQEAKLHELEYEVKQDDFFPYADCPHCFWTGYFTSRPALKYQIRQASAYLQAARQLEVLGMLMKGEKQSEGDESDLAALEQADALAQHHDGVSGTSKQHVAEDYSQRLSQGMNQAVEFTSEVLSVLSGVEGPVTQCQLLNESRCEFPQDSTFSTIIYNPLGQPRTEVMIIPIQSAGAEVRNNVGDLVESEVFSSGLTSPIHMKQKHYLAFQTGLLPPLTANYFSITPRNDFGGQFALQKTSKASLTSEDILLTNGILTLRFDMDGALVEISRQFDDSSKSMSIRQGFHYYEAFSSENKDCGLHGVERHMESKQRLESSKHAQNDGAYILRPANADSKGIPIGKASNVPLKYQVIKGALVQEIHQYFSDWTKQIIRLKAGENHAEFEWIVGPIPIGDDIGKGVISRFESDISSGTTFYTDSNGREFQERKIDYRPTWELQQTEPVAGNYYPVNTGIYIKDDSLQLSILTDRSQGGSSLRSGEVELMVHRRGLVDDDRGVGEPLNETDASMTHYPTWERHGEGIAVRGKHYLIFSEPSAAMSEVRTLMDDIFFSPVLAFSKNEPSFSREENINFNVEDLPKNVALITLKVAEGNKVMVRLAHQFSVNESSEYSKQAVVDLRNLFIGFAVGYIEEVSLTANQKATDMIPAQQQEQDRQRPVANSWFNYILENVRSLRGAPEDQSQKLLNQDQVTSISSTVVVLQPMQIKTFLIRLNVL